MDIYEKYAENWDKVQRIDKATWDLLKHCIETYDVKTCVEFGCGLSTKLMDAIGVRVTAFENIPKYVHSLLKRLNQSTVVLYDDILDLEIDSHYDMAFIDGPHGGWRREPAYRYVSKARIPLAVCHDVWRYEEWACARTYFDGWQMVGRCMMSKDSDKVWTIALRSLEIDNESDNKL